MVFSSPIFLFAFLPITLLVVVLAGARGRNAALLLTSLLFYAWGETFYVFLMVTSIIFNYTFGLLVAPNRTRARLCLCIGVTGNLLLLFHFKYTNFLIEQVNTISQAAGGQEILFVPVHLPIGISFFTFQALTYLVDISRGQAAPQRSLVNLGMYIAMFPQLIAGPIIRYGYIAPQIEARQVTVTLFAGGINRFLTGLAKKVLLANPLGEMADLVFSAAPGELSMLSAWLGVACYAMQIYFDFSGYSDMAIGLGRMFGFDYPENFNYPYTSRSIREFWRRWHISLSTWFRDYVYLPLGGNRHGALATRRNLIIVFSLCGFWHGASWNFLLWGWLHGAFLILERTRFGPVLQACRSPVRHVYTLLVVLVSWVLFRADDLTQAGNMLYAMLNPLRTVAIPDVLAGHWLAVHWLLLLIACIAATPAPRRLFRHCEQACSTVAEERVLAGFVFNVTTILALVGIGYLSFISVAADTYNPFIYFRF